eukprot:747077-Pleurochrysis_carterae.AAC.1
MHHAEIHTSSTAGYVPCRLCAAAAPRRSRRRTATGKERPPFKTKRETRGGTQRHIRKHASAHARSPPGFIYDDIGAASLSTRQVVAPLQTERAAKCCQGVDGSQSTRLRNTRERE